MVEPALPVPTAEMLACAQRELAMRRRVYPRWVGMGRMKPADAERETLHMAAIVALLTSLTTPSAAGTDGAPLPEEP
jgi:hypothetical protein